MCCISKLNPSQSLYFSLPRKNRELFVFIIVLVLIACLLKTVAAPLPRGGCSQDSMTPSRACGCTPMTAMQRRQWWIRQLEKLNCNALTSVWILNMQPTVGQATISFSIAALSLLEPLSPQGSQLTLLATEFLNSSLIDAMC